MWLIFSLAANEEKAKLQSAVETGRKKFESSKEGMPQLRYLVLLRTAHRVYDL